jgi:hypothetical protein
VLVGEPDGDGNGAGEGGDEITKEKLMIEARI